MDESRSYSRFSIFYRIEHWVLTISFTLLAITGLVQQHVDSGFVTSIIGLLGGIETVRVLHHIAAIVLMFEAIYHVAHVGYRVFVLRKRMSMLPGIDDLRNALQAVRYNLGLDDRRPQQGFYTFEEKLEYWAVVWGTIVMGVTGFMLWNPIATTNILPGTFVPAAKIAHGLEAFLAVVAILIWHMYHVHLRHFNKSIFTGQASEEEMLDEHPKTLAEIKAGGEKPRIPPDVLSRRRTIFFPICGLAVAVMLTGVYFFVGYEKTALATVPPAEEVTVFVHLTPTPLPTIAPSSTGSEGTDWGDFEHPWPLEDAHASADCADCHVEDVELTSDCSGCHQPPSDHYGPNCADCHTPTSFQDARLPAEAHPMELIGAHASADCADCHVEGQELTSDCSGCHQPPSDHYGPNCADCHTPTSFQDARLPAEAHPIELIGAHASASCEDCHGGGEETPEYVCSNCHARPENHLPGECDICHTPEGFAESASFLVDLAPAIPHEVEGRDDCFMCHDPEGEIQPSPSNHVDYINEQCTLCHKTEQ
jgi:formate dehydrogenase gamma subunit